MLTNRHLIFWLIILSATFFLYIQMMVQHGIFFDGLIYGTLAKNLANNIGTVYDLKISTFYMPTFHEHPPLAMYLESLFFKVFGNAYFIERVYSFSLFSMVILMINNLWYTIYKEKEDRKFGWLPILLFLPLPLIFWSFTQNMLETTMTLFTLLSVLTLYKAILSKNKMQELIFLFIASLAVVAAFYSKGPVGLFPLATLFLAFLFLPMLSLKRALYLNIIFFIFVAIISILLLQNDALHTSMSTYLNQQVIASLEGHRDTVDNRFVYLFEILKETTPLLIISSLLFITLRKKVQQNKETLGLALLFIAIGFSASLPIMLSTKQYGFYLVPSIVFFSFGFSILSFVYVKFLVNKIHKPQIAILIFLLLFISSIVFTLFKVGHYTRQENLLKDIDTISQSIQTDTTIQIEKELHKNIYLNNYFMRIYNVELDPNEEHKYLLLKKDTPLSIEQLKNYEEIKVDLNLYRLYKAKF